MSSSEVPDQSWQQACRSHQLTMKKISYFTWPPGAEKLYSETLNLHSQRSLVSLSQLPSTLTSLQFNTDLLRKD